MFTLAAAGMKWTKMTNYVSDTQHPHLGGNLAAGDSWTYCPGVWDYVINRFGIAAVLDLGCGRGHSSVYFSRAGCHVIAVDGLRDNVVNCLHPAVLQDLTQAPVVAPVDLVHCHEVVEHIEEQYLDNLLDSLLNGRIILMTNGLPGQAGYHHVNLQETQYWIDHLTARGCEYLEDDTQRIRKLASQDGAWHMARSGTLFFNPINN